MFIRPNFAAKFPHLTIGQSQRTGGISPLPRNALNLGLYTQDLPENVQENRRRFAAHIGWDVAQFAGAHQVHAAEIKLVKTPGEYKDYDALITKESGVLLSITTADCIPVLIYDPVQEAYGAAHAGWKGTVANIAAKTIQAMKLHFSSSPKDCYVYLAAGIQHCYFEVKKDVAQYFDDHLVTAGDQAGQYFVDLYAANTEQLVGEGLIASNIEKSIHGTVAYNQHYFSYRKEAGKTGRMLSVIGRK